MTVTIRIFGGLQRFTGGIVEFEQAISHDTRSWDIVLALGIPEHEVWFVAINGLRSANEQVLSHGDKVDIFAPVGGG